MVWFAAAALAEMALMGIRGQGECAARVCVRAAARVVTGGEVLRPPSGSLVAARGLCVSNLSCVIRVCMACERAHGQDD